MPSACTIRRITPLLTTLALLGACSDDAPGGPTAPSSSGGIETTTDSSTTHPVLTSSDPFVTDPTNPDSSVTHVTTVPDVTSDAPTTSTTIEVTATDPGGATTGDDTTGDDTTSGGTTTTGDGTTGDGTTGCAADDPLCAVPPEEQVPTPKPDGVPGPVPGVYDDQGAAPEDAGFRALIGFPTRDRVALEARVADLYDPNHPDYQQYMTVPEWMTDHAPPQADFDLTGAGVKLGVVAAATYHGKDLQTFWKSFNITRVLPQRVQVMEPAISRVTETILDTQWSSSIAPGADVITYEGPDARNTSLLYVFNEAIARHEVSVLTDSFAHREDSEPLPLRHQYDHSALMGAALGITVISASGDSARPDTPCSSPFVTCVGGTALSADPLGNVLAETAWQGSGSGDAKSFNTPSWQQGVVPGNRRAMVDLALNASPSSAYWVRRLGKWEAYGGTSFSAPVFAGLVAVVNSYRHSKGLPDVGYLNPSLYTDVAVRASFRDVTLGGTDMFDAKPGWDYPSGWGAPRAMKLAEALP